MKQPDLEEEALRLIVRGRDLLIERQTMADNVGEVTLTLPSGATRTSRSQAGEPGAVARLDRARTSSACGAPPTASSTRWSMSARPIRASSPR